jgi:hypothetical protein
MGDLGRHSWKAYGAGTLPTINPEEDGQLPPAVGCSACPSGETIRGPSSTLLGGAEVSEFPESSQPLIGATQHDRAASNSAERFSEEASGNLPARNGQSGVSASGARVEADQPPIAGWTGVALAAGVGALLLTVVARGHHAHRRDMETVPVSGALSPEVIEAVARMDAFLKGDGDLDAARHVDSAQIRRWASQLKTMWSVLSTEAQSQLVEIPSTWRRVQQVWSDLSTDDRHVVRENWLPAQITAASERW